MNIYRPRSIKSMYVFVPMLALVSPNFCFSQEQQGQQEESQPRDRGFLGVSVETIGKQEGIQVAYVFPGSAAELMGLKKGDQIVLLNDVRMRSSEQFSRELRDENVNATLRMLIRRDGERKRVRGKIGSYRKTMAAYESKLRDRFVGKPFTAPPHVDWWNPEKKSWEKRPWPQEELTDALTVVFSFDSCAHCEKARFGKVSTMAQFLGQNTKDKKLRFVGIYFSTRDDRDASLVAAKSMFEKMNPAFAVGVASFPEAEATAQNRDDFAILYHHGVAVIASNQVKYLQVVGPPEEEFWKAYRALLDEQPST